MILIDLFTGTSQFDILKRGVQKLQPYRKLEVEKQHNVNIESGVYDFQTEENYNGSFWLDKRTTIYDLKLNGIEIPAAIIQVSAHKNVIKTALAGQDMSVKEIVGFEDYQIQVAGLIIDENGYPQYAVADLNKLFRLNEALEVECEYLRIFDIHYLVVEDFVFPPIEGFDNTIPFEFMSFADQPVNLN